MNKTSNSLSEEGEVIPLSNFLSALIGHEVITIRECTGKQINLSVDECRALHSVLAQSLGESNEST